MSKPDLIDSLQWIRIFTPLHIPKYLVDQVRDREFSVEDFYKYQEKNCLINTPQGQVLNPLNHLYVLANEGNIAKGFLWFTVDPLSKDINLNTFSMDKEYWGKGKAVSKLVKFIKDILEKSGLNKVFWVTNYPNHSMRHGFHRSRSVLMEFDPKKEILESDKIDESLEISKQII